MHRQLAASEKKIVERARNKFRISIRTGGTHNGPLYLQFYFLIAFYYRNDSTVRSVRALLRVALCTWCFQHKFFCILVSVSGYIIKHTSSLIVQQLKENNPPNMLGGVMIMISFNKDEIDANYSEKVIESDYKFPSSQMH